MTPGEILERPPLALQQAQRQFYYDEGYLVFPSLVPRGLLADLRAGVSDVVETTRNLTVSSDAFDLEPSHSAENPRLRRAAYVDDLAPVFWDLCRNSILTDIAVDLLGPDLRFRDMMINFKWARGGAEVKWHQDIVFYPHTNVGTCQFLVMLEDVGHEQGPLQVIPGSHKGPLLEHYDANGNWTGAISDDDLEKASPENAVTLTGPAGTVTVHHSCAIHGSQPNHSDKGRPALVVSYSAADAVAYTAAPYPSSHYCQLVRGVEPRFAHHQDLQMPLPPDWSDGYTSIFEHQEDNAAGN